jgi:CRISPR system Cascade subunit CasE
MITQLTLSYARQRAPTGASLDTVASGVSLAEALPTSTHLLLRQLFAEGPEIKRDFLWRDEGDGHFVILSQRPPADTAGVFQLTSAPFAPEIQAGDTWAFTLRANPVVTSKPARTAAQLEKHGARARGQKLDIVLQALKLAPDADADAQTKIACEVGIAWFASQGSKAGFTLPAPPIVDGYSQGSMEKSKDVTKSKGAAAGFSVLDFKGVLQITDPQTFLAKLATGFGSAKAYGNGLMLIKRA